MGEGCRFLLGAEIRGESSDLAAVKAIADACRHELGFVCRAALADALQEGRLVIARSSLDRSVLGFAHFRSTRHGYVSVYEIAVHPQWRGRGVGRALIDIVTTAAQGQQMQRLRLKCPIDLPANGFYSHLGFVRVNVEGGKHRPVAVWEKALRPPDAQRRPEFFLALTNRPGSIEKVVRMWDGIGDLRDPFRYVVFTPMFSSPRTLRLIRRLKEERGSVVVLDSGGYQVQTGKIAYEELFERLLDCYRRNLWADWYVLPDHVPCSSDDDREVEFKVRETLDFARLFLRMMPEGFAQRAVGVVHGRTVHQVRRCMEAYVAMGLRCVGFGSFGTAGRNGSVNMVSRDSLRLLSVVTHLAREYRVRLHLFGIGSPNHLVRLAESGALPDSFDSSGWWKAGGYGKIFFPDGPQLHITRIGDQRTTQRGIENERARVGHCCPFCTDTAGLRRERMLRVMHNLAAMLETVERLGQT